MTTPISRSVSAMARTSSISGTFVSRQRSPVSVAAASILRAAFFAPLTRTVPSRGRPPVTRYRSGATLGGSYSQWKGRASATSIHRLHRLRDDDAGPPGDDVPRPGSGAGPAGALLAPPAGGPLRGPSRVRARPRDAPRGLVRDRSPTPGRPSRP